MGGTNKAVFLGLGVAELACLDMGGRRGAVCVASSPLSVPQPFQEAVPRCQLPHRVRPAGGSLSRSVSRKHLRAASELGGRRARRPASDLLLFGFL